MTIKSYITTDFAVISIKSDIKHVKTALNAHDCLVVMDETSTAVGLLTCADLVGSALTAGDCCYTKPLVGPDERLLEVTSLMKQTGHTVLPVGENGKITGVISSNAILYPLAETVKKYQLLFRHVTHDLRNPIGNITTIFSLLEESLVKTDNIELLHYGQAACKAALDMLTDLLDIEKKDNNTAGFRIVNLSEFMRQCIDQLKGIFIPRNITLETDLTTTDFFAKINAQHLQRVIHNLLSNAVKFSPQNGLIKITAAIKNDKFLLTIKDHGVGIPFEMQAFVFDQFTVAQQQGTLGEESTGLGLYFARKTVELHGGRIWFESAVATGTTFFIELPRY